MNTPQVIYIGKTIWSEEKIYDSPAYFNEEVVRDALVKAYTHANLLAGNPQAERHARIRVENVINKMKGGNQ